MDQDETWHGMQVSLYPGHIVLDGDPVPPPTERGTAAPHFQNLWAQALRVSVYNALPMSIVAKRHGWIKMPFGREVGLGPVDFVLDKDPAPPSAKGHSPPVFVPCLLWPNGHPSQLLLSTCYNALCSLLNVLEFCTSNRSTNPG